MNLPIFNTLLPDSSTYITFSKAHLDFDYAIANKQPYYFSKMVALKLPLCIIWKQAFFPSLSSPLALRAITGLPFLSPPSSLGMR